MFTHVSQYLCCYTDGHSVEIYGDPSQHVVVKPATNGEQSVEIGMMKSLVELLSGNFVIKIGKKSSSLQWQIINSFETKWCYCNMKIMRSAISAVKHQVIQLALIHFCSTQCKFKTNLTLCFISIFIDIRVPFVIKIWWTCFLTDWAYTSFKHVIIMLW